MKGEATVEGYVAALNRGARLLECNWDVYHNIKDLLILVDLFDGEAGQPVITHKRTLIQPITLKDTLHVIFILKLIGIQYLNFFLRDYILHYILIQKKKKKK